MIALLVLRCTDTQPALSFRYKDTESRMLSHCVIIQLPPTHHKLPELSDKRMPRLGELLLLASCHTAQKTHLLQNITGERRGGRIVRRETRRRVK